MALFYFCRGSVLLIWHARSCIDIIIANNILITTAQRKPHIKIAVEMTKCRLQFNSTFLRKDKIFGTQLQMTN